MEIEKNPLPRQRVQRPATLLRFEESHLMIARESKGLLHSYALFGKRPNGLAAFSLLGFFHKISLNSNSNSIWQLIIGSSKLMNLLGKGWMSERLKESVLKTEVFGKIPGVRIERLFW